MSVCGGLESGGNQDRKSYNGDEYGHDYEAVDEPPEKMQECLGVGNGILGRIRTENLMMTTKFGIMTRQFMNPPRKFMAV